MMKRLHGHSQADNIRCQNNHHAAQNQHAYGFLTHGLPLLK
ncbi:hypothetical protein KCQ_10640 [Pectobacterium atrosepticum ICMP 1526]|nr:hypothetical protein KCQ_10640 [Pectobacterium atrosepticum ICMP 1526]